MADPVAIVAVVGGIVGIVGGSGGLLAVYQTWQQGRREHRQDVWNSFEKQVDLAEARGDVSEANRIRREYEGQLEAWRAQQQLAKLVPGSVSAASPVEVSSEERHAIEQSLERAQKLGPALLSWRDYLVRANALSNRAP